MKLFGETVSEKNVLLSRQYSVCAGFHTQFTRLRQVSLFSPASAVNICLTSSQNLLFPALTCLVKKVVPLRDLPHQHSPVTDMSHSTRPKLTIRWPGSEGVGWDSVETSFPYYSWFPFASHRGFELFLSIAPKHRLLADVSACNLFHSVSPHAWMVLFPFLSAKPVHPLIQLQPFIAGFLADPQQTILFALQMIRVLAPWILELSFYASYKDKRTVFFQSTHPDPLRWRALALLQKAPFALEERNAPQCVLSICETPQLSHFLKTTKWIRNSAKNLIQLPESIPCKPWEQNHALLTQKLNVTEVLLLHDCIPFVINFSLGSLFHTFHLEH